MPAARITTRGAEETRNSGRSLGEIISGGSFITLRGELGAGKTTFVQGLAEGLGVKERYITSPSFALVNEYEGRVRLYHVDLYRLEGPDDLADIGFDELPGDGVAAVEWPERAEGALPDERLDIEISVTDVEVREITFTPHGKAYEELTERICPATRR